MLVKHPGCSDLIFLSWIPEPGSTELSDVTSKAYTEITQYLSANNAIPMQERIWGDLSLAPEILSVRRGILDNSGSDNALPPTYIGGTSRAGSGLAGIHMIALHNPTGGKSSVVEWKGQAVGHMAKGHDAQYLAMSDVGRLVRIGDQSRDEEVRLTFEITDKILTRTDWSFQDVRRTWYFLHNILDWYGDFNQVRNAAFQRLGLGGNDSTKIIPASTGIRGRNAACGWCALDLLAIRPLEGHRFEVNRLENPKQNEATEYGSAFSRGLAITLDSCRYIFVSGTASINEKGESVHNGDFESQTIRTIETVKTLLAAGGAGISDICQATAFLKNTDDIESYRRIAARMGVRVDETIYTVADVCRDELLFELDATAVVPL
ncbi:MAG: hypothetical protein GY854_12490 [Deltaproteobacteria bacterium]|nr:hypothetical protein [Deltaproteobacteria bacterium]